METRRCSRSFFEELDWCPGAEELWDKLKDLHPTILTGVPKKHGEYEQQKRRWVARKLGLHVSVICCESKDKIHEAQLTCTKGERPVLVDDWDLYRGTWTENGGLFVHHKKAKKTVDELILMLVQQGESVLHPINRFDLPEPPLRDFWVNFKLNKWARGGVPVIVRMEQYNRLCWSIYDVRTAIEGEDLSPLFEAGVLEETLREQLGREFGVAVTKV